VDPWVRYHQHDRRTEIAIVVVLAAIFIALAIRESSRTE